MNTTHNPLRTTIVFGLLCRLFFIPLTGLLRPWLPYPLPFRLTLWLFLAVYSLLLVRWSRGNLLTVSFPLLVLLIPAGGVPSSGIFLLTLLGALSWIRSGICFSGSAFRLLIAEGMLAFGGGALVDLFAPRTPAAWALAIWLFFLVQSLYFVLFDAAEREREKEDAPDAFEQARREAEKILSGEI